MLSLGSIWLGAKARREIVTQTSLASCWCFVAGRQGRQVSDVFWSSISSKPSRSHSSLCHGEEWGGSVVVGYSEVTDALDVGQVEAVQEPVCAVSKRTRWVDLCFFLWLTFLSKYLPRIHLFSFSDLCDIKQSEKKKRKQEKREKKDFYIKKKKSK